MIAIDQKLTLFSEGVISNFYGKYIAGEIAKLLQVEEKITPSEYLNSTLAGGFANVLKQQGLSKSILAVGLYYVIQDAIAKLKKERYYDNHRLLYLFLFDSILVYFLVLFVDKLIYLFIDEKPRSFSQKVLKNTVNNTIINAVLSFRN